MQTHSLDKPSKYYLLWIDANGNAIKNAYASHVAHVRKLRKQWQSDAQIAKIEGSKILEFQKKSYYQLTSVDDKGNINKVNDDYTISLSTIATANTTNYDDEAPF